MYTVVMDGYKAGYDSYEKALSYALQCRDAFDIVTVIRDYDNGYSYPLFRIDHGKVTYCAAYFGG